ncbi:MULTISPECIES: nucleoside/nucleotide kinase family protein [unclassified Luteococcus]|uniref:nucleoside/nucleotide kinase family protein n=1 Tax=unclassified Luteococcus TaxID=2639923 RepID=UPI00313C26EF
MRELDTASAIERARTLLDERPGRVILGLAGAPGAGKSHLATRLHRALPGSVVVGMDGFHLAHSILTARGDVARKGTPDTFDAHGYVALLQRLRDPQGVTVWAPEFRREVEDAIAGAVEVPASARLVITEGNYLLLETEPWCRVRGLCDEIWFVAPDEELRVERLVGRHVQHGRAPEAARERALTGTDGRNAALVAASRERADAVIR